MHVVVSRVRSCPWRCVAVMCAHIVAYIQMEQGGHHEPDAA